MMKNTMKVDLKMIQLRLQSRQIIERDDHFEISNNLGGGATLLLTCSKELPISDPGFPINPLWSVDDLGGLLMRHFGGEYEQLVGSAIAGTYYPAEGECPEHFEVTPADISPMPHALVEISWPLDNPPTEVGLDSEFARRHQALAYYRVDTSDSDADYSSDHGTDLWVMPTNCLGEFQDTLRRVAEQYRLQAAQEIKRYLQRAPYYRNLFHEGDEVLKSLHLNLEYGDEKATLALNADDPEAPRLDFYYDEAHLRTLQHLIESALKVSVLGDLFGGLAHVIALGL